MNEKYATDILYLKGIDGGLEFLPHSSTALKVDILYMTKFQESHPKLNNLVNAFERVWPEHLSVVKKGILSAEPSLQAHAERLATLFNPIIHNRIDDLVKDYKWVCQMLLNEQMHFFRTGDYRLSKIEDAVSEVYSVPSIMEPYMNGLLISQFIWTNHTQANEMFVSEFLPLISDHDELMEVGPGHGMFLAMAALEAPNSSLYAWDISETSLEATVKILKQLGITKPIETAACDLVASGLSKNCFDAIVCSEVLEHTDQPGVAIQNLTNALKADGKAFLNVPVNSPAPDHLTLWRHPDEVEEYYTSTGMRLETFKCFPGTGLTLERAIKQKADITCVGILRKS